MESQKKKCTYWSKNNTSSDNQPSVIEYCVESLAIVYSPYQRWNKDLIFIETGLDKGTIFAELDKPFYGYKTCGGGSGMNSCSSNHSYKPSYTKPFDISRVKTGCN